MTIFKPIYFVLLFALFLSGCSTLKKNVPFDGPKEGARARIRVVISSFFNDYASVRAYPNAECIPQGALTPGEGVVVNSQFGFEANLNGQKIGMPETLVSSDDRFNKSEIYVRANQPIVFNYGGPTLNLVRTSLYNVYYARCGTSIMFVPQDGVDYEIEFDTVGLRNCDYRVSKIDASIKDVLERNSVPATMTSRCPKIKHQVK